MLFNSYKTSHKINRKYLTLRVTACTTYYYCLWGSSHFVLKHSSYTWQMYLLRL